jgi:pyruvate/2-oxoglutarate dehydrogenase complex dihydrolipoamide acyltransferase (E2) component
MEKRHAVLVTDRERTWLQRGVRAMIDAVQRQQKKLEELGLGDEPCRDALDVLKGDGVDGGLITRFEARESNDLFATAEPSGVVRMLYAPTEESEGLPDEPVDPDEWVGPEVPVEFAQSQLDEVGTEVGGYYESEDGSVYRLLVRGAVEWEYLGTRPQEEVDAAVEASERAEGKVDSLDGLPWASPAARQLAKTEGLRVEALAGHGTGQDGRLTKRDVLQALEDREASEAPTREEAERAAD